MNEKELSERIGYKYYGSMSCAVKEEKIRSAWAQVHAYFVADSKEALEEGLSRYLKEYPPQGYGTEVLDRYKEFKRDRRYSQADTFQATVGRRESCE